MRNTASVVDALYEYADLKRSTTAEAITIMRTGRRYRDLLESLCELEHEDRNDELLAEFHAPAREGGCMLHPRGVCLTFGTA